MKTCFPKLIEEWDYERNSVLPENVSAYSNKKVFWICKNNSEHKWSAPITSRTNKESGCPICSSNQLLKGFNDLKTRYPSICEEWDYEKNYPKKPEDFFPSSKEIVWWKGKCGHSFDMPIVRRTGTRPQGCPYCAGKRILIGFNDFGSKYPDIAKEWDYEKNAKGPNEYSSGSSENVFWRCAVCGNSWKARIYSRVKGTGCPLCKHKRKE